MAVGGAALQGGMEASAANRRPEPEQCPSLYFQASAASAGSRWPAGEAASGSYGALQRAPDQDLEHARRESLRAPPCPAGAPPLPLCAALPCIARERRLSASNGVRAPVDPLAVGRAETEMAARRGGGAGCGGAMPHRKLAVGWYDGARRGIGRGLDR